MRQPLPKPPATRNSMRLRSADSLVREFQRLSTRNPAHSSFNLRRIDRANRRLFRVTREAHAKSVKITRKRRRCFEKTRDSLGQSALALVMLLTVLDVPQPLSFSLSPNKNALECKSYGNSGIQISQAWLSVSTGIRINPHTVVDRLVRAQRARNRVHY
jgi:hypothetical protein